jgi:hypothetical protein
VKTGQNPKYDADDYYCFQCALALHAVPEHFAITDNLFYDNRRGSPDLFDADVTEAQFMEAKDELLGNILTSENDWFRDNSRFLAKYASATGD